MKYVALDIGNVCIHIDRSQFIRALGAAPETPGVSEKTPAFLALSQRYEFGQLTERQFFDQAKEILFPHDPVPVETIRLAFDQILRDPVPGMEALIGEVRKSGIGVAFFSDVSFSHLNTFRRRFPIAEQIPGTFSFEVGCWKPDPQMFEDFERKFGTPLLYTDDRADLIEAARKYGWNAELFRDAETLRKQIGLLFP